MQKKAGKIIISVIVVLIILAIFAISKNNNSSDKNLISLKIQLDLKEDIGLLLIDSDINGEKESGGASNADKKMLKKDDTLYWSIDKQHHEDAADIVDLIIQFTVVAEYCDPNFENIYPEELMIPMEEISFKAEFGKAYSIRITGDKVNGYQAILE